MKSAVKLLPIIYMVCLSYALFGQGERRLLMEKDASSVRELYENDMYAAVQSEVAGMMLKYEDHIPAHLEMEMQSYYVFSGIRLKQTNIDALVADFGSRYPHSPRLALIKFEQSLYYFEKGDYSRSIAVLRGVENKYLSKSQRLEYMFNKAYCNMRVGDNKEAMAGFKQIIALGKTPYLAPSTYYLGYLHYISNGFSDAVKMFKNLESHHEYSNMARYYISESYFMMKEYANAIAYGEKVYEKLEGDLKLKSVRVLSQSYYEMDNPKEAKRYLEMYSSENDNLSRKDNYYTGVVSYSLQSYYAAVDAFSKVIAQSDSLAQNAYLYLGNCYLKIKNKVSAMNHFKEASALDYDRTIQEEALFLYAKLAFDLNSDITPFTQYIAKYPSSVRSDEIYNYIATAYLQNKNFKDAIGVLGQVKNLTPGMMQNLQKASFFRAMQLLDMNSYRSAIDNFKISVANGAYNPKLVLLAKFWMGEAHYRMNEFAKTVEYTGGLVENKTFQTFNEYPMGLMNMGYSYFSMKRYADARVWFEKYMQLPPSKRNMTLEAKSRIADAYYMEKDYERAAEIYEEVAIKTFSKDDIYATYMGAISYGLISQPQKKISMLSTIIKDKPSSDYYHKSVYELGRTYVQQEEYNEATGCFNTLLNDPRDSTYITKSLLELGMINSNLSKHDKALEYFEKIVQGYPLSPDVPSALAGIESVYQLLNKPEQYLAYLEKVGMSSIKSADEREQMLFNSCEQLFLAGKYAEALVSLASFIEKYPEGAKTAQAYFYQAESYSKTGKPEFAADAYLKVMSTGEGAFAELATLYYGKTELELEHFEKAAQAFESLGEIAQLENNKYEALLGQMRGYYGMKNYPKTIVAANSVLVSDAADSEIRTEATYKMAKSHYAQGERDAALPLFTKLAGDYASAEGAESAYILILNAYDEGDFEKVENLVYAFSDAGTPHMYWLAKSFIVLGDSFADRDEWEQAKATFESIKEGYSPEREHDDVLEQVEMRLSKIKGNE